MALKHANQKSVILWVITGVLVLFFAVTGGLAWKLRKQLRNQVISRDGEVLMAVASAEVERVRELNEGLFSAGADEELFEVALNTSEIKGVIGVRVFKKKNVFVGAIPISLKRGRLELADESLLLGKHPVGRFNPRFSLKDVFLPLTLEEAGGESFPVLEVLIPLYGLDDEAVSGFAQYFIDGGPLQEELDALDSNIVTYAGGAFLFGGLLAGGMLYWAFRKLRLVNMLLEERTQNLISANHKLSMEARTAAIGAITSHLIHGLKGPLQGIRQFVSAQSNESGNDSVHQVWRDAADTTQRMQNLINEVMEVLQDQGGGFSYEISISEINTLVEERMRQAVEAKGVHLEVGTADKVDSITLGNDRANLIILILVNLVRNAIDASHRGDRVVLRATSDGLGQLCFEVEDQAGGLPGHVRDHLFQPVASSKPDGSGVGLSLCRELSRHLKGRLELARTSSEGTVFRLCISTSH